VVGVRPDTCDLTTAHIHPNANSRRRASHLRYFFAIAAIVGNKRRDVLDNRASLRMRVIAGSSRCA
jgi:hypothetical protein